MRVRVRESDSLDGHLGMSVHSCLFICSMFAHPYTLFFFARLASSSSPFTGEEVQFFSSIEIYCSSAFQIE